MKTLRMFFSSLLLIFAVCEFSPISQLQADQKPALPVYIDSIAEISLGYEDSLLTGIIKLQNGLTMRIIDYSTRDDNVMKTWTPGDQLVFKTHIKNEALVLTADRINQSISEKAEPYVILDVVNSPAGGLVITEIKDGGKYIKLSDNSVWQFTWYQALSTKAWKVNERVLVHGAGNKEYYDFINLDAPVQANVASATGFFIVK